MVSKLEYVELRVEDLSEPLEFNTGLMGLHEISRDGDAIFLGAGLDENFDLGLVRGGRGLAVIGFAVNNSDELKAAEARIAAAGLSTARKTDSRPGVAETVSTSTPNGVGIDIVVLRKRSLYLNPASPAIRRASGIGPRDLDHVNLVAEDVPSIHKFFTDVLGLHSSDLVYPGGTEQPLAMAWMRVGEYHHDVAVLPGAPGATIHHTAWTVDSFDHLKMAADLLAGHGISIEWGPGRHTIGANLSMYFQVPGGHRYELCCEMARVPEPSLPPGIWPDPAVSSWGQVPSDPETFFQGC